MFEAEDGWRYSLWLTNRPATTRGWLGPARLHRRRAPRPRRVEDAIPTGEDTGLGHLPSFDYGVNQKWLASSVIAAILLAWLKLLALDGDLARTEAKTLRYHS